MLGGNMSNGDNNNADDLIKDSSLATFATDVIVASKETPVVVDFWAPNCAPCRELTPLLERLVENANGTIKLVKINLQENPELAAQLQIQTVPTVFIFKDGRPIDGFTGLITESELVKLLNRLGISTSGDQTTEFLNEANRLLETGDAQAAASIYAQILSQETENPDAIGGMIKCYIAVGELETAQKTLSVMPKTLENEPAIISAKSALDLALKTAETGDVADLRNKLSENPNNHQIRFDLAIALNASNDREGAINQLIDILKNNREWQDGAAQSQLIELFEIWGPKDPNTIEGRKKLSSLLFS